MALPWGQTGTGKAPDSWGKRACAFVLLQESYGTDTEG